ncbi:MAG: hypothetical protein KC561_05140 [Myxococcales bacterium]|nr:hypothetical protein [Myxococcales bacterium]
MKLRLEVLVLLILPLFLACDKGEERGDEPAGAESGQNTGNQTEAEGNPPSQQETATPIAPAEEETTSTYDMGSVGVRVVNLMDRPVDVYVQTNGRVRAFPIQLGLPAGGTTDYFFPPEQGRVVAMEAGSEDTTCVSSCDHYLARVSIRPEQGNSRILIVHDSDRGPTGTELWENAPEDQRNFGNALLAPVEGQNVLITTSEALNGHRFGLRMGVEGTEGCAEPLDNPQLLIGGTSKPAFNFGAEAVQVSLYSNQDRSCSGEAVAGPIEVPAATPGSRQLMVLYGTEENVQALVLPLTDASGPPRPVEE